MTIPGLFGAPIAIQYEAWITLDTDDGHGNAAHDYADPVTKYVTAIHPLHRLPHHDIASADYEARSMLDYIMIVPDASIYHKNDRVTVWDMVFLVQGYPFNWGGNDPFGFDKTFFGGEIHIERVT